MNLKRWMLSYHASCDLCGAELYADNWKMFDEQMAKHEMECK